MVTKALIALGANLPLGAMSPVETVRAALTALDALPGRRVAASAIYATPCMPAGAGPDYANAVAALETPLDAGVLLARLHRIEMRHARSRTLRWGARTLDLDLLDWGGRVVPDAATWRRWAGLSEAARARAVPDRLILPHPRLHERAFVLVPLAEIAPGWRHPVLGRDAASLRDALPETERAAIRRLPVTAHRL